MRSALDSIYLYSGLQFCYVTLVGDSNPKAYDRLTLDYNFGPYPSCFYGGGYVVVTGPPLDTMTLRQPILDCGERPVPPLGLVVALEHLGQADYRVSLRVTNNTPANVQPNAGSAPSGPMVGQPGIAYDFEGRVYDPEGDRLFLQWSWGDGDTTDWLGPISSGQVQLQSHTWNSEATYPISIRAKDFYGEIGTWSPVHEVVVATSCCLIRGDIDDNGVGPDIADLVALVSYMFQGAVEPACLDAADINGDEVGPDIADLVALVGYMFQGGPAPTACP
ncbi:MAG: hypothetical protein ABIE70_03990 [bacterium]